VDLELFVLDPDFRTFRIEFGIRSQIQSIPDPKQRVVTEVIITSIMYPQLQYLFRIRLFSFQEVTDLDQEVTDLDQEADLILQVRQVRYFCIEILSYTFRHKVPI
jgi:hypothetical protein